MGTEMHDVVQLLLARMESHPEEFLWETGNRWQSTLGSVREYGTPEEINAIDAGLRVIMLQQAHEGMLDELLNGDERRRREEEETSYERNLGARLRTTLTPALQKIDAQMQQEQLKAYEIIYNAATGNLQQDDNTYVPEPWENNGGLVNTIRKGLRLK